MTPDPEDRKAQEVVEGRPSIAAVQRANAASPDWTTERDASLKSWWGSGRTAQEIGEFMGISRCAVLGRRHRLSLPLREPKKANRRSRESFGHTSPEQDHAAFLAEPEEGEQA